jgi:Rieske Fe-S protein
VDVKDKTVLTLDELERITRRKLCATAATGLVALVVPSCMGFVIKGSAAESNPPSPTPLGTGGAAGAVDDPGTGGNGGTGGAEPDNRGGTGGIADAGSDGGGDARRTNDTRTVVDTGAERSPDTAPVSGCSTTSFNTNRAATSFAVGTATFFSARRTFVCRDAGGLYTVTSICTHQGCDIDFVSQGSGFSCPCHGSRFNYVGAVTNGPAGSPLRHYEMCIAADGRLWFDTSRTVTSTVRVQA